MLRLPTHATWLPRQKLSAIQLAKPHSLQLIFILFFLLEEVICNMMSTLNMHPPMQATARPRCGGLLPRSHRQRNFLASTRSSNHAALGGWGRWVLPHHRRFAWAQARAASDTQEMISEAEKFIESVTAEELQSATPSEAVQLESQLGALEREVGGIQKHRLRGDGQPHAG
jgi:hypothetical protein